jgi:serine/threonine protein kinase
MKADNILTDQDGMCKISDFGTSKKSSKYSVPNVRTDLALTLDPSTADIYNNNENMSMQGSIFWMAPEGEVNALSLLSYNPDDLHSQSSTTRTWATLPKPTSGPSAASSSRCSLVVGRGATRRLFKPCSR